MTLDEAILHAEKVADGRWKEATKNIKLLGEELRKFREGITDDKVLIGFNMAIAICNKYLGESEVEV